MTIMYSQTSEMTMSIIFYYCNEIKDHLKISCYYEK